MDHLKSELEEIANLCKSVNIDNQELEKEINSLVRSADDVVVLVYSRRCLEVIITDICETSLGRDRGTEPLKGIIDKFSKEKLIPAFVLTAMQNVNNNSTYGAHPKDFDKRQVRSTLIDLTTVLDWYFFEFKKLAKKTVTTQHKSKEEKENPKAEESLTKSESVKRVPSKKAGLKPLHFVGIIFLLIAIGATIYFITSQKSDNNSNKAQATNTLSTPLKGDSVQTLTTQKQEDSIKALTSEQPATSTKQISNANTVKPFDLPEDLESALNIMKDVSRDHKRRKASIPVLLMKFTTNAEVVLLNSDGIFLEGWGIDEYLDKITGIGISKVKQIKITGQENEGSKIKLLKVEHHFR